MSDQPQKGQRWRSPSTVVYEITSVRSRNIVYGRQVMPNGRLAATARLWFDPERWELQLSDQILRADRRGYSGSVHAARRVHGIVHTFCGKKVGPHWRIYEHDPGDSLECASCKRVLKR